MVNTFITFRKRVENSSEFVPDYRKSACFLDRRRLLKQCIEAYQILHILQHLCHIAILEGWENYSSNKNEHLLSPRERAKNYLSRVSWVKCTRKKYLSLPYRYVKIRGTISKFPKESLPYKINKTHDKWEEREDMVIVWIKNSRKDIIFKNYPNIKIYSGEKEIKNRIAFLFPREKIVLPGDQMYTLGFSQHAVIKMWVGYEESLKEYINSHITEYQKLTTKSGRKCSINLDKFDIVNDNVIHPWWITHYDGVIFSHRASLLRKERERKEEKWYFSKKSFTSIGEEWLNLGYIWPGSFDEDIAEDVITDIISGKNIKVHLVASPISADKRPGKSQSYLRKKYNYDGPYLLGEDGYVKIRIC